MASPMGRRARGGRLDPAGGAGRVGVSGVSSTDGRPMNVPWNAWKNHQKHNPNTRQTGMIPY